MALVRVYIEKFGKEVLIEDDHPLIVAEKAKGETLPRVPRKRRSQQDSQ